MKGEVAALLSIEGGRRRGSLGPEVVPTKLGGEPWGSLERATILPMVCETSAGSGLQILESLVREMERLGMLVDVSHLSDASFCRWTQ